MLYVYRSLYFLPCRTSTSGVTETCRKENINFTDTNKSCQPRLVASTLALAKRGGLRSRASLVAKKNKKSKTVRDIEWKNNQKPYVCVNSLDYATAMPLVGQHIQNECNVNHVIRIFLDRSYI